MRYIDTMVSKTLLMGMALSLLFAAWDASSEPSPAVNKPSGQGSPHARRIALVVGNSHYSSSPLINPTRDADLIAKTLTSLGFEVRLAKDSTQTDMKRAIQSFGADLEKAGPDAVGLFYYAGHGLQLNGRNYLIPVGARIDRDADVEIEAVSADWVLEEMRYARNRLNFVILDACRNNPFARGVRGGSNGLARMDAPAGVLIAYSTAPGDVAEDGSGANSPYSEALARAMTESREPAELMFKHARDDVRRVTSDRQTPWESSSLTGQDFYFIGAGAAKSVELGPSTAPVTPAAAPVAAPVRSESSQAYFMSDALCAHAVGEWKIASDAMKGFINLSADASAEAKVRAPNATLHATWDCDAGNRRVVISFDGGDEHKIVMDWAEKLLFGYNKAGVPVVYTR